MYYKEKPLFMDYFKENYPDFYEQVLKEYKEFKKRTE